MRLIHYFIRTSIIFLVSLGWTIPVCIGQIHFTIKGIATENLKDGVKKGDEITLKGIKTNPNDSYPVMISTSETNLQIAEQELKKINFIPSNINEFWQKEIIQNGIHKDLIEHGLQYKLRKELEEEVLDYTQRLRGDNLLFYDDYLTLYLYSLIYKILPDPLNDGRVGVITIEILKDVNPNAFIFANGTLILTTGLLATLDSEEELLGVLAHEISHFVLDHHIANINAEIQRQKRAEFWAGVAIAMAASADVLLAANNKYYSPGVLTASTAAVAFSVLDAVTARMGIKYSQIQESTADQTAKELLKFIKLDSNCLASALNKIRGYYKVTGKEFYLSDDGTHPNINSRIRRVGDPTPFDNSAYDTKMSLVNTFNAQLEFNQNQLTIVDNLVGKNIKAGIATEDDLLLMAMINLMRYDNEEKNVESLKLIQDAKLINLHNNINVIKYEALTLIRLKRNNEAKKTLDQYLAEIDNELNKSVDLYEGNQRLAITQYLNQEKTWTKKMIHKVMKL